MTPDFSLSTARLTLRLIDIQQANLFATAIQSSASLYPWLDWCHADFSLHEAQKFLTCTRLNWVKNLAYGFGIFDKETDQFIGMAALTDQRVGFNLGSLGYWVCDNFQQCGYAKEAMQALIQFCFEQLKLTRLELICDPENTVSHKLALACGALDEGIARNRYIFQGKPKDALVFAIVP
ncbi:MULTISPECIES: GNAT family N-acetyltransferase [Vibrio]|uniref:GNAT family N-acetyltransferase n=1 Tax=Vibrio algicola TaxID=2662262 RepID=A0A5Q0TGN7_9VIBR|nr:MULTISPECIES: GNAT family protein [Vibrio]MBD1576775.1 GNAT family N-acetyltransferase [Vibrio sp. S11_S32]